MIVTPASIKALMTSWRKDFQGGLEDAPSQYSKIAMVVNSSTRSNTYGWLGKFPTLKEWVGKRTIQQMEAHGYSIANKTFEGTVGISVMTSRMTIWVFMRRFFRRWGVLRQFSRMS